jgi:adenine-specific DNA-methyltransferase
MTIVEYAHQEGLAATRAAGIEEQKRLGQFMTPPAIAMAMAERACTGLNQPAVRLLDPAAGGGILAAAAVTVLLQRQIPPPRIEVTLYEVDPRLISPLRRLGQRMRRAGARRGVIVSVVIRHSNFLLSPLATQRRPLFDLIIANPPYFKLNKSSPEVEAHSYAVHGQPNIYGVFMAACAQLLTRGGKWCFITPRSWTSGNYFAAARRHMLAWLRFDAFHVFESRQNHFTDDAILQEAMITWATAQAVPVPNVVLSTSNGLHDLHAAPIQQVPMNRIVGTDESRMITLPTNAPNQLGPLTNTLQSLGLRVSTGPVVAFRAEEFVAENSGPATVPFLWMQHIHRMEISWPIAKKREHIRANAASAWMLVENSPKVLLRRFSPKEDLRRVTAAPYLGELPGASIGLENHLNYIYRPGGVMNADEALGLAAYLNSAPVEAFFRGIAGTTQVNATELRLLPMPSTQQLSLIGRQCYPGMSLDQVDFVVDAVLNDFEALLEAAA